MLEECCCIGFAEAKPRARSIPASFRVRSSKASTATQTQMACCGEISGPVLFILSGPHTYGVTGSVQRQAPHVAGVVRFRPARETKTRPFGQSVTMWRAADGHATAQSFTRTVWPLRLSSHRRSPARPSARERRGGWLSQARSGAGAGGGLGKGGTCPSSAAAWHGRGRVGMKPFGRPDRRRDLACVWRPGSARRWTATRPAVDRGSMLVLGTPYEYAPSLRSATAELASATKARPVSSSPWQQQLVDAAWIGTGPGQHHASFCMAGLLVGCLQSQCRRGRGITYRIVRTEYLLVPSIPR